MSGKRVTFDAHKQVNRPTRVRFETKSGEHVSFVAEKPREVPVRVSFIAHPKKTR